MLPNDTKQRKLDNNNGLKSQQSVLSDHFKPEDHNARPTPYSRKALETAALEWLIETNQVH